MKFSPSQIRALIVAFIRDLDNSLDMGDRRDAVIRLAKKVGASKANEIAEVCGLSDSYYQVSDQSVREAA